jgi:hypothetical protein
LTVILRFLGFSSVHLGWLSESPWRQLLSFAGLQPDELHYPRIVAPQDGHKRGSSDERDSVYTRVRVHAIPAASQDYFNWTRLLNLKTNYRLNRLGELKVQGYSCRVDNRTDLTARLLDGG